MSELELRDKLADERKNIKTFDDLIFFLQNVKENCNTGYGEAPRAIAQAALATAWYLSSEFGITGFQAGCVMWDFIRDWSFRDTKCGLKIVSYDDMLYPQYEYHFTDRALPAEVFETMQKEAKMLLADYDYASPTVQEHWQSIVDGHVPFGYELVG